MNKKTEIELLWIQYFLLTLFQDLLTMNEELKKARKAFDAESYGEMV